MYTVYYAIIYIKVPYSAKSFSGWFIDARKDYASISLQETFDCFSDWGEIFALKATVSSINKYSGNPIEPTQNLEYHNRGKLTL